MSQNNVRYAKTHEWVKVEDGVATIGISEFASDQVGGVVFVDLPEVGKVLKQNEQFGVLESVKAVSELYTPVAGEVVAVNDELYDAPELLNEAPLNHWIIKVKMSNPAEAFSLLDETAYKLFCETEG